MTKKDLEILDQACRLDPSAVVLLVAKNWNKLETDFNYIFKTKSNERIKEL